MKDVQSVDEIVANEFSIVTEIYRAGGMVDVAVGDERPQGIFKAGEKPFLRMTVGWYLAANHLEVMQTLQKFMEEIRVNRCM